jgi:SAM-dependent methyltransferase
MHEQLVIPAILDACCGPRMFWFDSADRRALFIDKRQETHARDLGTPMTKGRNPTVIAPDILADFTCMPFADETFYMVVFDPPHLRLSTGLGIMTRTYGRLPNDWEATIRAGFRECFRVLKPHGTLIFKWNEHDFSADAVLSLTASRPLFGHRSGKFTHWYVFMKPASHPAKEVNHKENQ